MKKFKVLLFIILMFTFTTRILAVCNDKTLVDAAANIELNVVKDQDFNVKVTDKSGHERETVLERQYAYVLTFTPYNENLLIAVLENETNSIIPAYYHIGYKTYVIGSDIHYSPKKYEIYVYSQNKNSCYGELLRRMDYTVQAFNEFSLTTFCQENPNTKECAIDYNSSKLSEKEINKVIEQTTVKNMSTSERLLHNVKKYWYFILIPIVLISGYYLFKINAYKRKESKI